MMGTRRPMSRNPPGNGRYYDSLGSSNGSASESDDSNGYVYSPRADSRNYLLNVRPENRTTFCSIISQLTEETQPCFETTLKARAVSEGCDAKFICLVTGYPEPEVTWYKDDEEMDRYCGLPKYEIMRTGKRHTLQIYKCCEEDAAIYQASARNNKGIVSCSGVLEVGTMSEYKIHQRWFAKLKRKAEAKMREIEQSRRIVKENLEEGERLRALSPERIQRKRRFSSENKEDTTSLSLDKEDLIKVHIPDPNLRLQEGTTNAKEQPHNVVNGFTVLDTPQTAEVTTNGYALPQDIDDQGKDFLAYVYETVEVISKKPTSKEVYAKKKKKEDEPSSITTANAKKEESPVGSSPKKGEGISPAPRRSRFGKDAVKAPGDDKIEVQPAPVISNRRFANSNIANRFGKTIGKDSKKPKEVVVPPSKTEDSSTSKQSNLHPKEEVNFSLKDMYFGDGNSQPICEEKVSSAHETNRNTKDNAKVNTQVSSTPTQKGSLPSKVSPPVQVKELPKVAPRRSKEQRDQSAGFKPLATCSNKKANVISAATSAESRARQNVEPSRDKQKTTVDKMPECSIPLESVPPPDIIVKTDPSELLPIISPPLEMPTVVKEENAAILGEDEKNTDEAVEQSKTTTSSEDLPEDKVRTETLQKLQHLEMEYMALQKAYALLQQQLELSQKEEAQKIKERSSEPTMQNQSSSSTETKLVDSQANADNKENSIVCPSSPVPVYMETEESIKLEEEPIGGPLLQDNHEGGTDMFKSEEPSLRSPHSPLIFMECSPEEESNGKNGHGTNVNHMHLGEKSTPSQSIESQKEVDIVTHDALQPNEHLNTVKLQEISSESNETEIVPDSSKLPIDVEMIEDINQAEQMVEVKEEKPADSEGCVQLTLVGKSVDSSPEISSTLKILHVEPEVVEQSLVNPSEAHQEFQELSCSENTLVIPGAISSQKIATSEPNQSVATLLRDVKKALESGITSDTASSLETSPSSPLSPEVTPSTKMCFEVETKLPLPEKKEKIDTEVPIPAEAKDFPRKPKLSPQRDLPANELDFGSQPEIQQKEDVQCDPMPKQPSKQDHSLVTSLKNTLWKLFAKTEEDHSQDATNVSKVGDSLPGSPVEMCSPEGSLSPPSSRKIYDSTKDTDSPQSTESMQSSSTSGKLTPTSEEDMIQNVDSLQTSPTVPRRIIEPFKKHEVTEVASAPMSPIIPKRSSKEIHVETLLSKEELQFSPSTSRKIAARIASDTDYPLSLSVPSIVVGSLPEEKTLGSMFFDLDKDSSRKWRSSENVSLIPSATPEELASGARRKIYLSRSKLDEAETGSTGSLTPPSKRSSPNVSPGLSRRTNTLLASQSPPAERRSPGMPRKMAMLEVPKIYEETEEKGEAPDDSSQQTKYSESITKEVPTIETKKVNDPYKAPQVIRKIRAEQFSDASGNLKLWCQFFNILSDSFITWSKDEIPIARVKRSSGDEGPAALAIVQASAKDCGVYQCTIQNEYGTDSTDCLLSAEILSGFITKEDVEVGEEIEMTPMVFAKGLADSGYWGDKFFGRILMDDAHVGEGFLRKACRVKVIYGLEPMFESGKTCIIKIRNLITFGTKNESTLVEKNYEITIQDCKIQNTTREYCKIFAAECRAAPNFGQLPEVLPLNLIYRPANNIPYATIEEDLEGHFEKYCIRDIAGKLHAKNMSEIEQKCCAFQHWVFQWTNGNFLVTNLEGVGWKLTNIGIATKTKGFQGLKESCCPEVLEEFLSFHQCSSYCEMLGLKSLKANEGLQPPTKPKGSKSPSMGRKSGSAQSSPQIQKRGVATSSPQSTRKGGVSPKATRKSTEVRDTQSASKNKGSEGLTTLKPQ
ncbi:alpha- kinase 3 isoform X1 [Pelobates cultripes]|uniref:non-specific serine/threonine protein kinase n=2 Tax=Pelobates cultripes TaxID=61616 RepID=A0AAD1VWU6_PELCU|nr:alpha- kinase 3 isoform X1 [Pelobates cultripes]